MTKTVDIEVTPDGEVKLDYSGFKDKSCYDVHKLIEKELRELGIDMGEETRIDKPEMRIPARNISGMREGKQ